MYIFESLIKTERTEKNVLIVFSGQLEGQELDYAESVEKGFKSFANRPEEILFVYPMYLSETITKLFKQGSKCYDNITRYGDDSPVTLLPFNQHGELGVQPLKGSSTLCDDLISLRNQIVGTGVFNLASLRKDQVIMKAPSGTVFSKPSQADHSEFIRASELAVGYAENQFIAFALLSKAPKERKITKIYIDTNSISSFVEALIYYWMKFSNNICKPAVYHSFGSYDENGKPKIKPDLTEDVWLIISASTSNNMGKRMAKEWGLENDQVVTLLSYTKPLTQNKGDEILANIASLSTAEKHSPNQKSVMKVKVWGENFTAEVEKPKPIHILENHKTSAINSFIEPNISNGLFKCNRTINPSQSPSSIYVDFNIYDIQNLEYSRWLETIIDWHIPSKVGWIIHIKDDEASRSLANEIGSRLKHNGIMDYSLIDIEDVRTKINGTDCAVVALPVTGSGQILLKLNRNLRIAGHAGNRIFISPFVLAVSKLSFEQFKKSLTYAPNKMKYSFFSWRSAFIGHTDEQNSWERELNVINHLDTPFWNRRKQILTNYKQGINGQIGIHSSICDQPLGFTDDFAFWGGTNYKADLVNHEAVYLTVSSILQGLREKSYSEDENSLFSYVYQHAVLAPDNFTRFTDGLLQSCLWRAASVRELDYRSSTELSAEFSNILEMLVEEDASGNSNAAVDLLMGIASGKIQISYQILKTLLDNTKATYHGKNENALLLIAHIQSKYAPSVSATQDEDVVV
jgi:hypothetical protein